MNFHRKLLLKSWFVNGLLLFSLLFYFSCLPPPLPSHILPLFTFFFCFFFCRGVHKSLRLWLITHFYLEKKMEGESFGLIVGISLGVVIGVLLAVSAFFCFRYHRKTSSQIVNSGGGSSRRSATLPIRENGANSCNIMSDSTLGPDSPVRSSSNNGRSGWLDGFSRRTSVISASGILEYSYRLVNQCMD